MDAREILSLESSCIQEEPAYCSAACPVHVDVRSMLEQVQKGNFTEAARIYGRKVLFPGIISRICSEPCKNACLRRRIDSPVAIRLLERACTEYSGTDPGALSGSPFQRKQHIAVVGGGLGGAACALELAHKGYEVTLFEKSEKLGGALWDYDPGVLEPGLIAREMGYLAGERVHIRLNCKIEDLSSLNDNLNNGLNGSLDHDANHDTHYDAVYVATGEAGSTLGLPLKNGKIQYDHVSLESAREGIFAGGSLIFHQFQDSSAEPADFPAEPADFPVEPADSPIEVVAQGIRAARSMERYFQKASLTAGRENEGIQNTRLFTEIRNEPVKTPVVPGGEGLYTRAEAVEEAGRCMLCACMECVKACEFLAYFNQYPKRYLRDISKTVTALQGVRSKMIATRIINSCSVCGQCAEICPNHLDMGKVCLESRRSLVESDTMPPAYYEFWIRDMRFSNDEKNSLYKNQQGYRESKFLFFPGCQVGASYPDYVETVYQYLLENLHGGVGIGLGCCGAPACWAGQKNLHQEHQELFLSNWRRMGEPEVILACPTCRKMFEEYLPSVPVKSLWTLMEELPLPAELKPGGGEKIALYDPCASRYEPEAQGSVRRLLRKAGYDVEELFFHGRLAQCCSYGGLISTVNPALAQKITEHRISASPYTYVTYCINCRDDFAAKGKPAWYLPDLLFGNNSLDQAVRRPPSYSERRENRREVKNRLLKLFWGEDMEIERSDYEGISLLLSDELKDKLEKESILLEEIQQVIHHAETTGYKMLNHGNGNFIAHLQIGFITYWVEYQHRKNRYELMNAYSHRMQIIGEEERQRQ
ncbi:MAG TPA: FAD-dependent oxidoreductase [Anaerovoracaceae bacterium]|nr:FAD-dependent oxidoreductase [Anaerovoracaceae bacterium]